MTTISGVIASHSSFEWIMTTARHLLLNIENEETRMQSQPQSQHKRKHNNTRIKSKDDLSCTFSTLDFDDVSFSHRSQAQSGTLECCADSGGNNEYLKYP